MIGERLYGFAVLPTGGALRHDVEHARKGTQRYLDIVTVQGSLRHDVERAVIAEYQRQDNASKP